MIIYYYFISKCKCLTTDEPLATFTFNYSTYDNCMRHLVKTTDRILVHEDLSAKYPQMDAKQPEEVKLTNIKYIFIYIYICMIYISQFI